MVTDVTELETVLSQLVGERYEHPQYLKDELKTLTKQKVSLFCRKKGVSKKSDFLMVGNFNNKIPFKIWYLKDNEGSFYLTDVDISY